jgi:hypothetical protein
MHREAGSGGAIAVTIVIVWFYAIIIVVVFVGPFWLYALARSRHTAFLAKEGAWWVLPQRGLYATLCAACAVSVYTQGSDPYLFIYYYNNELDDYPNADYLISYFFLLMSLLMLILLISVKKPDAKSNK